MKFCNSHLILESKGFYLAEYTNSLCINCYQPWCTHWGRGVEMHCNQQVLKILEESAIMFTFIDHAYLSYCRQLCFQRL